MRSSGTALIMTLAAVFILAAVPLFSEGAEGVPGDVGFSFSPSSEGAMTLKAGETRMIYIHVYNPTADIFCVEFIGPHTISDGVLNISIENDAPVELGPHEHVMFAVTVSADRYTGSVAFSIMFEFVVYDPGNAATRQTFDLPKNIQISSRLASENQFNKIMGIWDNPLPEPFDTELYAAAITILMWFAIAFLIASVLFPRILPLIVKNTKERKKIAERKMGRLIFTIILLYGITICVAVIGAGEFIIDAVNIIAQIFYILLGAMIVWRIFVAVLDTLQEHAEENAKEDGEEYNDSIMPLVMMLMKIAIGVGVVCAILGVMGFDPMIIVTGAGIIGLAISFGAQSTMAQFFSGFTLLVNRPFKQGDLIRLDDSADTLRVMNVGFMMTTFRNWANSEIFTMPNQKVVSSTIINVTAESPYFRIIVLVRVPYGTDVTLAKKLALEAMQEHPRILQDGREEIPKVRVEEFSESAMTIRVSGFVDDFEDHRTIAGEIREAVMSKYRENGIIIAIPKMDVYVRDPASGEKKSF